MHCFVIILINYKQLIELCLIDTYLYIAKVYIDVLRFLLRSIFQFMLEIIMKVFRSILSFARYIILIGILIAN